MYEHNALQVEVGRKFGKGQKQSSKLSCDSSYINVVELLTLILHNNLQNHRPSGSGEEDLCYL